MKTCNGCDTPPSLPLAALEVEVARAERQCRFTQFVEIVLIVALVATNLTWAVVFNKNLDRGENEKCFTTSHTSTAVSPKTEMPPHE